jgi:hypothetical protein
MDILRAPVFLSVLLIMVAGCAEPKKTFRIAELADQRQGAWPVWPRASEVPRYVYVGDLTGEQNFTDGPKKASAKNVLAWLVGLGQEFREPLVLRRPQGVAEGHDGRVWVSDVSRQAVFLFDTVAGELHVIDHISDSQRFVSPVGLAPLPDGGVMVSDAELGIVIDLDASGRTRRTIGKGELLRPTGLVWDRDNGILFVADTRANKIKIFDRAGRYLRSIGEDGAAAGQLNAPTYLALAGDRLFVTDTLNARVQVFESDGRFVSGFGERGLYIGNMTRPKGIAVSDDGLVYVVESFYDHLLVFDQQGQLLLPIGGTGQRAGEFYLPSGVWAGSGGRVYVADMFNGRIAVLQYLGDGQ